MSFNFRYVQIVPLNEFFYHRTMVSNDLLAKEIILFDSPLQW